LPGHAILFRMGIAALALALFAQLLPTGVSLDPAGTAIDVGNMPLSMAAAPDGRHAVVLLTGYETEGLQVVDLESGKVTQTIVKPSTFIGLAFSPDGKSLYASGGNDDAIYAYAWRDGQLVDERTISIKSDAGVRYPAGLAFSPDGKLLYVAENVGDSLAVLDPIKGEVVQRLATEHYPYGIAVSPTGQVWVSAWGGESVSAFRASGGRLVADGRLRVGRHPSALLLNGQTLYVALASVDRVAIVDTKSRRVTGSLDDRSPGGPSEGSTPNALALSNDGKQLFVAEADNNAVAVFNLATRKLAARIPVDWYPTALVASRERLLVLSSKGHGTHPNPHGTNPLISKDVSDYTLKLIKGTIRSIALPLANPAALSRRVAAANRWSSAPIRPTHYPPFEHVVYIIKENRTYDQIFGDMPQGDGDPSLIFFPREVSPNHHSLAERFGLFDRFFCNAEVSQQGHIWSTAAYVTDYGEKTVHPLYSDKRPDHDEGDVDEPAEGFLWTRAIEKGVSLRIYGEQAEPDANKKTYHSVRRAANPDTSPDYPPFDMTIPDQKRAAVWIAELQEFVRRGAMPQLEIIHLPSDHTSGGKAGRPTPRAYMADNDLALGRMIEALSQTPFWRNTVVFVVEDDAQDGADHVDSHRSVCIVISPWCRGGVQHHFINTSDVVGAIDRILGLRPMSQYDLRARPLEGVFGASPDVSPYHALTPSVSLDEKNAAKGKAAELSSTVDFDHVDNVDDALFNRILWEWRALETRNPTH
jgi:YVTN family beta-propeller protein